MNLNEFDVRLARIEKLLLGTQTIFSLSEAAQYTNIAKSYLYKLTASGVVPFSKPMGKKIYFEKSKLDAWLLQDSRKTNTEIEQDAINHITLNPKAL